MTEPIETAKHPIALEKRITDSLGLALSHYKASFKSPHWDVFPKHYVESLRNLHDYENFRSNGLTYNLDDSYPDIPRVAFLEAFVDLVLSVGKDFLEEYSEATVGNPKCELICGHPYNYNDLFLTQFAKRITHLANKNSRVICDIGGGYGGLGVKLKRYYPSSTIVLFDLPEINALQIYYVSKCFPDAKILTYKELVEQQGEINTSSSLSMDLLKGYDFVILPGWCIEFVTPAVFDLVINTRSMMEMHSSIIGFYFEHIHRTVRRDGIFYCVNRYEKRTVGYPIRLRDYPFDSYWDIVSSAPSWRQSHIHELVVGRTDKSNNSVKQLLESLPLPLRKKKRLSARIANKVRKFLRLK